MSTPFTRADQFRTIGYQAIFSFIYFVEFWILAVATGIASSNISNEKKKTDVLGLLGFCTAAVGIFVIIILRGFYSDLGGVGLYYVTPGCSKEASTGRILTESDKPTANNLSFQTITTVVFTTIFVCLIVAIAMINSEVKDEDALRDLNGLIGYSISLFGVTLIYMGIQYYRHGIFIPGIRDPGCGLTTW